jgi:hypothetical protein
MSNRGKQYGRGDGRDFSETGGLPQILRLAAFWG